MRAEPITAPIAHHAEGPVWSDGWGGLRWVDLLAGDVLSLRPDGTVGRRHVAEVVAALRPRTSGGAVLGIERGFALEAADGAITPLMLAAYLPTAIADNAAAVVVFRRYGFLASLLVRQGEYLVWHILYGNFLHPWLLG